MVSSKTLHAPIATCLLTGALLAIMLYINSQLAKDTSAFFASWVAHGTGMLIALTVYIMFTKRKQYKHFQAVKNVAPKWAYLGGIPGAFTLILAAIAVNSPLGLTLSMSLFLSGQILFSLVSDQFGWFGLPVEPMTLRKLFAVLLIIGGSSLLLLQRYS